MVNTDNLEYLVFCLLESRHEVWNFPRNVCSNTFQMNFPEVTLEMVDEACKSLWKKKLLKRRKVKGEYAYLHTRVWKALGVAKRDRYGNMGEE